MAKQNKSKKKKRPAPAAKPAQTAPAPEQPPRTAKLMAALCYQIFQVHFFYNFF